MADIHCTVITRITHSGDVGEPGFSVSGEEFPSCNYSGSHEYWHGATQDALINVIPPGGVYMTEAARASISDAEYASVSHRITGMVDDNYRTSEQRTGNRRGYTAWLFNPASIVGTVDDVVTPIVDPDPVDPVMPTPSLKSWNVCEGVDLWRYKETYDGGEKKALIERDSVFCGYSVPTQDDTTSDIVVPVAPVAPGVFDMSTSETLVLLVLAAVSFIYLSMVA